MASILTPTKHDRTSYSPIEAKPSGQSRAINYRSRWNKTASMFSSLLIGIALAVCHAVFYWWLDGNQVDETLSQAWVTNIGTAFTFLVKMFLVIAAGIAFVQHRWRNLRTQTFEVDQIDAVTAMTEDIFSLLDVRLWPKVPVLVIIAAITWLIPVAAVFPPGTLRVSFEPSDHIDQLQVPQLDFTNNTDFYVNQGTVATYSYSDAAPLAYTAALASGTSGRVLSLPHKYTNMTYAMQFYAPAIQCRDAGDNLTGLAVSHINTSGSGGGYFYISFVGGSEAAQGLFNSSGLECGDYGTCARPLPTALYNNVYTSLDHTSTDSARLYVLLGYNLTECQLFNASYNTRFDFRASVQTVAIDTIDLLNPVAHNNSVGSLCYNTTMYPDCMQISTIGSYQAIMQAFGGLYVGSLNGHSTQYLRYQTLVTALSIAPNLTAPFDAPTFRKQMEDQFQNITLSMLSFPGFM